MITYRVRLDVPRDLVLFVSRLLARRRKEAGTRKGTRCLGCYRQALFVLAWYRDKAVALWGPWLAGGCGGECRRPFRWWRGLRAGGLSVLRVLACGVADGGGD